MTMRAVVPRRRDSTAPKSGKAGVVGSDSNPQPFLRWAGKTVPLVEEAVVSPPPVGAKDHSSTASTPPPDNVSSSPSLDRPPVRPPRPDSLDKDSFATLADTLSPIPSPALKSPAKFESPLAAESASTFADLEIQFDDIISTYSTNPTKAGGAVSPLLPTDVTPAETLVEELPAAPAAGAPTPADLQIEAIQAKLAELGMDAIDTRPAKVRIVPGTERAQTLVSLERRTAHLSGTPLYADRLALLQRLEVAMGAFLRVEDAETILLIEKVSLVPPSSRELSHMLTEHPTSQPVPEEASSSRIDQTQRGMLGRLRSSWRPQSRKAAERG